MSTGKSIIIATHDWNAMARSATEVVLIEGGRVAYSHSCDGILTSNVLDRVFGARAERLQSANGHAVFVCERRREAP